MAPITKKKGGKKDNGEVKTRRFDAGDKKIIFKGKPELKKEFSKSKCPFGTGGWHLQELHMASLTPEDVLCNGRKRRKPYEKPDFKASQVEFDRKTGKPRLKEDAEKKKSGKGNEKSIFDPNVFVSGTLANIEAKLEIESRKYKPFEYTAPKEKKKPKDSS